MCHDNDVHGILTPPHIRLPTSMKRALFSIIHENQGVAPLSHPFFFVIGSMQAHRMLALVSFAGACVSSPLLA